MAKSLATLVAAMALTLVIPAAHADQTIVFLRHGEKPPLGLGQLDCQGLNRALAYRAGAAGKIRYAHRDLCARPASTAKDKGVEYNYIRPLATIEPTAIRLGMPVNTSFGVRQLRQLEQELLGLAYSSATIYVAWEHNLAQQAVQQLIAAAGGNTQQVPVWTNDDFDSLYVLHVKWQNGKPVSVSFEKKAEGLNHQSVECPGARS